MPLTDAQILIRRCDRSKVNELRKPAHNAAADHSDRLGISPHAEPAPAAAQLPPVPAAVGAFIDTPVHGERNGN